MLHFYYLLSTRPAVYSSRSNVKPELLPFNSFRLPPPVKRPRFREALAVVAGKALAVATGEAHSPIRENSYQSVADSDFTSLKPKKTPASCKALTNHQHLVTDASAGVGSAALPQNTFPCQGSLGCRSDTDRSTRIYRWL